MMRRVFNFILFLSLFMPYARAVEGVDCGVEKAHQLLEKLYYCPTTRPNTTVLFENKKLRDSVNAVCYLCEQKKVNEGEGKEDKLQVCQSMYAEVLKQFKEIELVMASANCSPIKDNWEKTLAAQPNSLENCQYLGGKVLRIKDREKEHYLCIGHVYCPSKEKDRPSQVLEAHCVLHPKYPHEKDNSVHADNLRCPPIHKCAYDLSSIQEVTEIENSWERGKIVEEFSDYLQKFTPGQGEVSQPLVDTP